MAEEQAKKLEVPESPAPAAAAAAEPPKDVAEEKSVIPTPLASEDKYEPKADPADDSSKAIVPVQKETEATESVAEEAKPAEGSVSRDKELARLETEKRMSFVKAWEESEKSKAENRAHKKVSAIESWENSKKAAVEAQLEQMEKKKAEYAEKMKNKIAEIHKQAEEKRAMIEAKRGEDLLKAEEIAAKYRATGTTPKNPLGCGCF
ncbi:unnamed protein product [Linum perenne]